MIAAWMVYAVVVSCLVAVAAEALDTVVRPHRRPTRWIWLGALGMALGLPTLRLLLQALSSGREQVADLPAWAPQVILDPITNTLPRGPHHPDPEAAGKLGRRPDPGDDRPSVRRSGAGGGRVLQLDHRPAPLVPGGGPGPAGPHPGSRAGAPESRRPQTALHLLPGRAGHAVECAPLVDDPASPSGGRDRL
jgi:hypothetical protein